jgi:hypothetical protein
MGQVAETESTLTLAENVYVNLPTPVIKKQNVLRLSVYEMSKDKMSVFEMSEDKMSVYEMSKRQNM